MFGVFHVKNHDFTQKKKKIQFQGGRAPGASPLPPPESAPVVYGLL
jgi:hypothetical protein